MVFHAADIVMNQIGKINKLHNSSSLSSSFSYFKAALFIQWVISSKKVNKLA